MKASVFHSPEDALLGKYHIKKKKKSINNVVLVSGVQQSDSVIHTSILFQILFPFRLLQNIEQSSLCSTAGLCWLSVVNTIVCVHQSLDTL